jgi:hypothetical protein
MATVNAGKYGYIVGTISSSWTTARTSGNTATNQPTTNGYPTQVRLSSGRGGDSYWVRRFFAAFDVSAYASGYTISDLTFNFRSDDVGSGSVGGIVVESTAQGNADTDLSASDFWSDIDMSTTYSSNFNWPDSDSDISVDLNSTAEGEFSNSYLRIAVVEYEYDYPGTAPLVASNSYGYMNWQTNNSGYVPYISFTATATGYGNAVAGVASSSIGEVINVASANIGEVIGI